MVLASLPTRLEAKPRASRRLILLSKLRSRSVRLKCLRASRTTRINHLHRLAEFMAPPCWRVSQLAKMGPKAFTRPVVASRERETWSCAVR